MIAVFVDDLLFRSKIRAVAAHTGAVIAFPRGANDPSMAEATLAIVDLDGQNGVAAVSALAASWPELRVVGFVSHVHAERIRDARAAGAVDVMARSAFVTRLPDLLS